MKYANKQQRWKKNSHNQNVWKSSQRMNLRDVGSETSVNDSVQTNKNDK